jgi:hypothetical protein
MVVELDYGLFTWVLDLSRALRELWDLDLDCLCALCELWNLLITVQDCCFEPVTAFWSCLDLSRALCELWNLLITVMDCFFELFTCSLWAVGPSYGSGWLLLSSAHSFYLGTWFLVLHRFAKSRRLFFETFLVLSPNHSDLAWYRIFQ